MVNLLLSVMQNFSFLLDFCYRKLSRGFFILNGNFKMRFDFLIDEDEYIECIWSQLVIKQELFKKIIEPI